MENYEQLCVWPGTIVGNDVEQFEQFMLEDFDVRVKYHTEVLTNPDIDENGNTVEGTGGRNDLFFYIHNEDILKFSITRLQVGIRWWEDVVKYNPGAYLYTEQFLKDNPTNW